MKFCVYGILNHIVKWMKLTLNIFIGSVILLCIPSFTTPNRTAYATKMQNNHFLKIFHIKCQLCRYFRHELFEWMLKEPNSQQHVSYCYLVLSYINNSILYIPLFNRYTLLVAPFLAIIMVGAMVFLQPHEV